MMKSEFVALLKEMSGNTDINPEDYCTIEHVYTYHPAIKDKKHIVQLYLDFGMTVINDMLPRADKCAQLEDAIRVAENELELLRNQLMDLNDQ
jgi:hypothetical protein